MDSWIKAKTNEEVIKLIESMKSMKLPRSKLEILGKKKKPGKAGFRRETETGSFDCHVTQFP